MNWPCLGRSASWTVDLLTWPSRCAVSPGLVRQSWNRPRNMRCAIHTHWRPSPLKPSTDSRQVNYPHEPPHLPRRLRRHPPRRGRPRRHADKKPKLKKAVKYGMIGPGQDRPGEVRADQEDRLRGRRDRQPVGPEPQGGQRGPEGDRDQDPRRHRLGPLERHAHAVAPGREGAGQGAGGAARGDQGRRDGRGRHRAARARRRSTRDVTYEQCWERSQAEVKKAHARRREGEGQDRHRGGLEQLHHQAGAVRRVRRRLQEPVGRRRTSTARTWSSTACRRPTGSASSASGC